MVLREPFVKRPPHYDRLSLHHAWLTLVIWALSLTWAVAQVPSITFPGSQAPGSTFGTGVPGQFPGVAPAPVGGTTFGTPFDPYASSRTIPTPPTFPSFGAPAAPASPYGAPANPTGGIFGQGTFWGQPPNNYGIPAPPVTAPTWPTSPGVGGYPAGGYPPVGGAPYGANPYGSSPFGPGSPYYNPGAQPSMFPNGFNWGTPGYTSQKVFQDVGFRYTWISGEADPNDLDINDIEVHGSLVIPGFLNPNAPLLITPGAVFHLWDGPHPPNPANLPAQAYSLYVDFAWQTPQEQVLGADIDFRVGAYSDFNTFTSDSIRFQGQGLGLVRLTPAMTLKFGVRYLDRAHIKLLPAAGILWQPNPQVKLDIFFPQPKLSMFLTTVGTAQVWGYVAGEYGGGNWTIKQGGFTERVDINDIRVTGGVEWFGSRGVNGFVEGGYVFNREVFYVVVPANTFNPQSTFIVRGGLSF